MATTSKMGIPYPASTDLVTDGATNMKDIADQVDAKTGLVFIKSQSLTTVTNNISDVFSSTYNAYRVVISDLNNATGTTRLVGIRFRNASGDDSTSNYVRMDVLAYGTNVGATGAATAQNIGVLTYVGDNTEEGGAVSFDVINPNLAKATAYLGQSIAWQPDVSAYVFRNIGGVMRTTTVYTGFSIIGVTDNLLGTVRVYGYNQ
jgi:hypothetical protein